MERTMGRPERPDGLYDYSYIDRYGVRITICWDQVRGVPEEEIQRRRERLAQVVREIQLNHARRMLALEAEQKNAPPSV